MLQDMMLCHDEVCGRVGDVGKCSVCDVKCSVRLGGKWSVVGVSRVNQTLHHTTKSREAP